MSIKKHSAAKYNSKRTPGFRFANTMLFSRLSSKQFIGGKNKNLSAKVHDVSWYRFNSDAQSGGAMTKCRRVCGSSTRGT